MQSWGIHFRGRSSRTRGKSTLRRRSAYRILAIVSLSLAATLGVLAIFAVAAGQTLPAGAAGLCAGVFFIPGLAFLNQSYRLVLRETALKHVASIVQRDGSVDPEELSKELGVSKDDLRRILNKAVAEGYVAGTVTPAGRFIATGWVSCPRCDKVNPRNAEQCAACGSPFPKASP
jgi:hypothetical protein